jgi:hypothetical protein
VTALSIWRLWRRLIIPEPVRVHWGSPVGNRTGGASILWSEPGVEGGQCRRPDLGYYVKAKGGNRDQRRDGVGPAVYSSGHRHKGDHTHSGGGQRKV